MATFDEPLFDADNHYYEALDAFTRHAQRDNPAKAVRWVVTDEGKHRLLVGDRLYRFIANPTFDPVARPGALTELFRRLHAGRPAGDAFAELDPIHVEYRDRDARLARMDEQGVERCFLLPTLGLTVEHLMKDDVEMTYDNLHAFNRWLEEDWGFAYQDRIYAPPLLSLLDVGRAVQELEWVLGRGARVIHIRPGPVYGGRSPADPAFDPFWSRVEDAGLLVAFHAAEAGYNELLSVHWGEPANPPSHLQSAFQWATCFGDRPVVDTMAALVLHNLFGRFPGIRVASIEMGSIWVPYLLEWLDKAAGLGRRMTPIGGPLPDKPSDVFRHHVFISPFPEEDIAGLAELIGADHVLLGSDWPHAEGLREPREYLDEIEGLNDAQVRLIARENALGLVS
jgi:predicted TIM-barrel fold metal-dependent hydrolase